MSEPSPADALPRQRPGPGQLSLNLAAGLSPDAATGKVAVQLYEKTLLRPGDIVHWRQRPYMFARHHGPDNVLVTDIAHPAPQMAALTGARQTIELHRQHLEDVCLIPARSGRTEGLRLQFWRGPVNQPASGPRSAVNAPGARTDIAAVPLTVGGGLSLRQHSGDGPRWRRLWLSVPGYDILLTYASAGRASARSGASSRLAANLETAGQLDGGLSAAGRYLAAHASDIGPRTWTALVHTHFGLDPHPDANTPRHTLIAELAPTWPVPLDRLAAVLDQLDLPAAP